MGLDVARIDLPYVHQYRDRHGRWRRYYRRPGTKIALPGEPDSPEFMAAYQNAVAAHAEGRVKPARRRIIERSLDATAVEYYASKGFAGLRETTKTAYRGEIERLRAEHGWKPVEVMERRHVEKIMTEKLASGGIEAANNRLRVLRLLLEVACGRGWLKVNPAAGVKKFRNPSLGFHSWTDAEIEIFAERWPLGSRQHLAFALLLYTGQRRGDVILVGRQHVRGGMIEIRQQKTGKELSIPVMTPLKAALDAAAKEHMTYLTTAYGKPFTAAGFGNWFRGACDAAGLKHCSAHGLRKAAARRLAEAGCTAHQIAAITGQSLQEVQRYTRAAEQKMLARAAVATLSEVSQKRSRKALKEKGEK